MARLVDMAECGLSRWEGEEGHCRLCNDLLTGRQKAWCSKRCYRVFERQHRYSTARNRCRIRARSECGCPDSEFTFRVVDAGTGEFRSKRRPKHPVCAKCRKCEPELVAAGKGKLECNHIDPVLGACRSYTCKNHEGNLEMLCHDCHLEVTREQRRIYPQMARVSVKQSKRKMVNRTTKPGRNKDRPVKRSARRWVA